METWTILRERIPERVVRDKRLGRHRVVDSRDAAYPHQASGRPILVQSWPRHIPILNQGGAGSCTGNAETGLLGTGPFFDAITRWLGRAVTLDEVEAVTLYSAAETIDGDGPYPPNDNGSSGPSVAHAARNLQLIAGWTHAADVAGMADALQDGPVIIGVNWYDSFDTPGPGSLVTIAPGASVRGGHEVVVRHVDPAGLFGADNSWGPGWGDGGSFLLGWDTMARLFAEGADCTVQTPLGQPPPAPVGP